MDKSDITRKSNRYDALHAFWYTNPSPNCNLWGVMSKLNNNEKVSKILDQIITITIATTSLTVFPWLKLDSTNLPKFVTLTSGGFACLIIIILSLKKILASEFRNLTYIYLSFILVSTLVILFADLEASTQIFGRLGRNTGYISYISLFSILMITSIISTKIMQRKFLILTLSVSSISLLIGYLQFLEISPIRNISDFGKVVGFFSNVNFHSAFIGIVISTLLPYLLSKSTSSLSKILVIVLLFLGVGQILISDSIQGLLIFLISSSITFGLFLRASIPFKILLPYIIVNLIILFMGYIALQNKGPLASLIYEASIKARGDYWSAGWKMTTLHPWFGVGFDGYGDWYRRTRTVESVLSSNKDVTTDAAHNVFLDISSSGGFPLLLVYLILVIYTLISAIRVLRRSKEFNAPFVAIFAGWVAYQVQSLISINQLGLAIWGWVLTGLIVGYEINTRGEQAENSPIAGVRGLKTKALSGFLVGAIIAVVPFYASFKMQKGFDSADVQKLRTATVSWPFEIKTMIDSAEIFRTNGYNDISLEIARLAVDKFPEYFDAWYLLSLQPNATLEEKYTSLKQLKRLNPKIF
jgi:O-antigen ligase